ncbi:probable methyltransferase PMT10 [Hibiscus syriacus]|uniref:probable methyltransferase PMT10 n=1 Tax=Hibiscus syriacus TaxID=106335 RepID=UPI001922EE61|nr:probable methyltransferase PMT10 [Hibiscus syriacus]
MKTTAPITSTATTATASSRRIIDVLKTPKFVKLLAVVLLSVSLVFLVTHLSSSSFPFSSFSTDYSLPTPHASPPLSPPPPPPPAVRRTGIIDENGTMSAEFIVGESDSNSTNNSTEFGVGNEEGREEEKRKGESDDEVRIKFEKYKVCEKSKVDYVPCLDNEEAIKLFSNSERGEKYERHCPGKDKMLDCVVPTPKGYQRPIPWPQSRDEVWFSNVPHTRLVEDKGGQNWISIKKDKFIFPGGGTQFIHGADQYLNQISQMVPEISFGCHVRVALDIGCGVASFGAFLLQRNVTTLSIAPKDVHENQIQFALERGVPAMVAVFATHRLLYPSQAFDLIHCSRCRINWTRDDGILLLEVNRMLRAGGYFVWAAQPVYKHEEILQEQWKEMEDLTSRICWELVKKEGYIAIWRKPLNNSCYLNRDTGALPPLCDPDVNSDNVWYVDLKACITQLPGNGYGSNVNTWPARLHDPPDRLQSIEMDAYISRKEILRAESKYWNEIIDSYIRAFHWKDMKLRNVMDMRAGLGGFAAALHDLQIDCWVMNVVPVSGFNTLPVIYDRGLIGIMHDWCEPFDTYPRTYDLLHASGLFSVEKKRCNMSTIMLEMDRILRPGGRVYIRDSISIMGELKEITTAMGWVAAVHDTGEGPHASWRILISEKRM